MPSNWVGKPWPRWTTREQQKWYIEDTSKMDTTKKSRSWWNASIHKSYYLSGCPNNKINATTQWCLRNPYPLLLAPVMMMSYEVCVAHESTRRSLRASVRMWSTYVHSSASAAGKLLWSCSAKWQRSQEGSFQTESHTWDLMVSHVLKSCSKVAGLNLESHSWLRSDTWRVASGSAICSFILHQVSSPLAPSFCLTINLAEPMVNK